MISIRFMDIQVFDLNIMSYNILKPAFIYNMLLSCSRNAGNRASENLGFKASKMSRSTHLINRITGSQSQPRSQGLFLN